MLIKLNYWAKANGNQSKISFTVDFEHITVSCWPEEDAVLYSTPKRMIAKGKTTVIKGQCS